MRRVLVRNDSVQQKQLESEAEKHRYKAERGIFEPQVTTSATHEENNQQNTIQQQLSTLSPTFDEKNNLYDAGLEALVPTGAKVRLGYSLQDLHNNLQTQATLTTQGFTNGEYVSFFGLTVTQPLLKNGWASATKAGIRTAELGSKIAFQEYRRQLMTIVSTAEASYWNLFLAQEQVGFFEDSVKTAETILSDNKTRLQAGVGSQLDVLQAQAGLALRRSKLSEAQQRLTEAADRMITLCSDRVPVQGVELRAVDAPELGPELSKSREVIQTAFDLNPDYAIQREKLQQAMVRLGYARNQHLPELNLKTAYGLNGLGASTGASWDDLQHANYPSWSAGLELRVPLGGGTKTRHELQAARLQVEAAEAGIRDLATQIFNGLDSACHKIQSSRDSVAGYRASVDYNQRLLDDSLARLKAGKLESRRVLEIEADLLDAKTSVVDALVQYQRARLELELLEGTVLKERHLEVKQSAM